MGDRDGPRSGGCGVGGGSRDGVGVPAPGRPDPHGNMATARAAPRGLGGNPSADPEGATDHGAAASPGAGHNPVPAELAHRDPGAGAAPRGRSAHGATGDLDAPAAPAAHAARDRQQSVRGDDPYPCGVARERRRDIAQCRAATGVCEQAGRREAAVTSSRAVALALALFACGGGKPPAAAPKQEAAVDSHNAEKDAKCLLTEIYETIQHADTDGLMTLSVEPL